MINPRLQNIITSEMLETLKTKKYHSGRDICVDDRFTWALIEEDTSDSGPNYTLSMILVDDIGTSYEIARTHGDFLILINKQTK